MQRPWRVIPNLSFAMQKDQCRLFCKEPLALMINSHPCLLTSMKRKILASRKQFYISGSFTSNFKNVILKLIKLFLRYWLWLLLHGTLERICMETFRVGTDRLPFTRSLGTVLCRTVTFNVFMHEQFQATGSLSINQEQEKFLKMFSHHTHVLRSLTQNFLREQIFQLSSAIVSRISPFLISKHTSRARIWVFTRELFGSVPCGTYFLGGPVLVPLAVLSGTVSSVPV